MRVGRASSEKYWTLAARDEVARQLRREGYSVSRNESFDGIRPDLVARRGEELIVYEFKTPRWSRDRTDRAKSLRNRIVHELGGDSRLVWVAPPVEREIEIEGLEMLLSNLLMDDFPGDLDVLSTHTRVEGVTDVEVSSVHLSRGSIVVHGQGLVEVELMWGSESDQVNGAGLINSDSYPFAFGIVLDSDLGLSKTLELRVDTSSYYEGD